MTRTTAVYPSRPVTRRCTGALPRRALAAGLAAALALGPVGGVPARADGNGEAIAAAALFGLVAGALIATTRDGAAAPRTGFGAVAPHTGDGRSQPSSLPPPVTFRAPLPVQCRFDIAHGADRGTWYGRACLVATYPQWELLPARCEALVGSPWQRHERIAYRAGCLARAGYRSGDPSWHHSGHGSGSDTGSASGSGWNR